MHLVLPYPPTANHLKRILVVGRRGMMVSTGEFKKYQTAVKKACEIAGVEPLDGPISVTIEAFRPRKAGDLDNVLKAAFDSMKGYCFHDDKQIVEIHAYRGDDKDDPRLEVTILNSSLVDKLAAAARRSIE